MKWTTTILIATLALCTAALADEERFELAREAYNAGRYTEAAQTYESMLTDGLTNMEIHYNLANAYFKNGQLPQAVWHYRKAWYENPRDPDILANLRFAQNAAGAVPPDPPILQRFFNALSLPSWKTVAWGGYLAVCLLLLLAILSRRNRRTLLGLCLLPAAAMVLAFGGWRYWNHFYIHSEYVVTKPNAVVRHSPFEEGVAYYKIPPGALVQQEAEQGNWLKITYDDQRGGWINRGNLLRISP